MNVFIVSIFGTVSIVLCNSVAAQYRNFTNREGKILNALPLSKTENEILVTTKDGRKFTLNTSLLSDADNKFISEWKAPGFKTSVSLNTPKKVGSRIFEKNCIIRINKTSDGLSVGDPMQFRGDQQNEVVKVLEDFVTTVRDRKKFLNDNSVMGDAYTITLHKFKNVFPKSVWKIDVYLRSFRGDNQIVLSLEFDGYTNFSVGEKDAEYLLLYLKSINTAESVRKFIRQKESVEG